MTACIIVEDGTIVIGANTFITASEAESLLNQIGESYGDTPKSIIEKNLLQAMRYINSFRARYQGTKVSSAQSLQFPRSSVKVDGYILPSDTIPNDIKMAQALAALMQIEGEELQSITDGKTILQETIGPISVTYKDNGVDGVQQQFPKVDAYLKPYLKGLNTQLYRA